MLTVRPNVAELTFQLYGRSLHPELFQTYESRRVERGNFTADVQITSAGHVVSLRHKGLVLTEVAAGERHPLPKKRCLLSHCVRGERSDSLEYKEGVKYQSSVQLETVSPDIFWTFQQELTMDGEKRGLFHLFDANGRIAVGALSYVNLETRNRSLLVQTFHTFPDDYAIVKSQSLFEMR